MSLTIFNQVKLGKENILVVVKDKVSTDLIVVFQASKKKLNCF